MNNQSALGIIYRIPEYGRVKSRIAVVIGLEKALQAYTIMLNKTIENVSSLTDVDIYGFYDIKGHCNHRSEILERLYSFPQRGNDLGERMFDAIRSLFSMGYKKVALIGADSPDTPIKYIEEAFLRLNNDDLVIGPAEDGGYYLIGMKEPFKFLFEGIGWGRKEVLEKTILKAKGRGIKYSLLPEWYDIDDIDGLKRWPGFEIRGLEIGVCGSGNEKDPLHKP